MKIVEAAFRSKDGRVVSTGPIHDVTGLPVDFDIQDEGFLTDEGNFLSRKEVTDLLNNVYPVQSQELALKKSLQSEYEVSAPRHEETSLRFDVIHKPTNKSVGFLKVSRKPSSLPGSRHTGYHFVNDIAVDRSHRRKGLASSLYNAASAYVKSKGSNGIASQGEWRSDDATEAWKRMATKNPDIKKLSGIGGNKDFRLSEEPMDKAKPAPEFPGFGSGIENRRETPITSREQTLVKLLAMNHGRWNSAKSKFAQGSPELQAARESFLRERLKHINGFAVTPRQKEIVKEGTGRLLPEYEDMVASKKLTDKDIKPITAVGRSSAKGTPSYQAFSMASGKSNRDLSTKHHEDLHGMFHRIRAHFAESGHENPSGATRTLASNIFHFINPKSKQAIQDYVQAKLGETVINGKKVDAIIPKKEPKKPSDPGYHNYWHEEHLAHMLNYLNDPNERTAYLTSRGGIDETGKINETGRGIDADIKNGYKDFKTIAPHVDESLGHSLHTPGKIRNLINKKIQQKAIKKSLEEFNNLMKWEPSQEDQEKALNMSCAFYTELPEFKAAKFLAHGYQTSEQDIEDAMSEFEGDFEAMALHAHKLPVSEAMVSELRQVMSMELLDKAEAPFEVAAIPRIVKPFTESDTKIAKIVRTGFEKNAIHPVKLGGKHSAGSALLKDKTGKVWFLKPGSGKLSNALGIKEETASQSKREVAFNRIAGIMGLGHYVPNSALLLIDSKEVAALEFFSDGYTPLDKLKNDKTIHLEQIFSKFVANGLLYKWAAMDYLLGQVDRHAGNMMMDEGHNVRFIDAGSSMAGFSFAPSKDPKSFVPFYLRLFSSKKFKHLTPEERFKSMPEPTPKADEALKGWLDSLDREAIIALLNQYGINPEPFNRRLNQIVKYPGPKSEFLRKFNANLISGEVNYGN